MKWFRLYAEIKDDPKMLELEDHQFRIWINLLAMASEADDRGTIPAHRPRGLAASLHTTPEAMQEALDLFAEMGMVRVCEGGCITVVNFLERQYDKPSAAPERVSERVSRHREKMKQESNAHVTPSNAVATPEKRAYSDSETEPEEEKTPPAPKKGQAPPAPRASAKRDRPHHDPEGLRRFYALYPKKKDAPAVQKAWDTLRPDEELQAQIDANVREGIASADWQEDGGRAIPYPATYLNNERWNDTYTPAAPPGGPSRASPRNGQGGTLEDSVARNLAAVTGVRR